MTTPLWCLVGFVAWTTLLLLAIAFARVGAVLTGVKKANEFPSGVPHGGDAYWRLNRAHMNCLENLPIFGALVLVTAVAGIHAPILGTLAKTYLGARIAQSVTHVASGSVIAVNVRFTFFVIQCACVIWMMLVIWRTQSGV